jgi:hypothetical protein
MRIIVTAIFTWLLSFCSYAQLSSGTIAPDFVVTDINGNSHHLYDYLGQGYSVVLQFDATWNGAGWTYANSGALSSLYYEHGVDFGGNVIVLFLEADGTTNAESIYGIGSISQGNWTSVVPFPIIDLPSIGGYATEIGNLYEITYYPTIYTICPNGIVTETSQISGTEHWDYIQNLDCQSVYEVDAYIHNYSGPTATCSDVEISFVLSNLGLNPITTGQITVTGVSPTINMTWNGNLGHLESTQISLGIASVVGPVEISFSNLGEQNFSTNSISPNILLPQFETSNLIQVDLMTDCWPYETSWDITDSDGNVIYTSPTYGDGNYTSQAADFDLVNIALPSTGCYFFNIYDLFGDGMNGTQWGCGNDGTFSLNGLDGSLNLLNNLYNLPEGQDFSVLSIPIHVTEIFEIGYNVTLNVRMDEQVVSPNGVYLAGSFQGWLPGNPSYEMHDYDGDGTYSINLNLPIGQYQYKFVNGNSWMEVNEYPPLECTIDGNRFINVTGEIINETYCFNRCTESCSDPVGPPTGNCQEIFISEYVEGTANNKALEIYNPTNSPIDLGAMGYQIGRFANGSTTPTMMDVTGIIPPHDVRVFVLDKRDPNGTGTEVPVVNELQALADTFVNPVFATNFSPFYFNGDDAVFLAKNGGSTLVDMIGKIGEDPGVGWFDPNDPNMTSLTHDKTLVRKSNIGEGVTANPIVFNPMDEWDIYDTDDFSHLGWHESWCGENTSINGCTNPLACNYNPAATIDNGDCLIVGAACDDNNANTFGDTINGSCECLGSAYNYGVLSLNDYVLCSENTQEVVLSFSSLPGGISQYTYQWYCRDGIQSAPSGNSTLGWTLVPGANSSMYSTAALESNKTFACFITPFAGVGLPAQWASGAITIEVANFSAQSIIGNPNITPFTNYVYVVNPIVGNTYNWSVTNGGIITGQGTNTVTVMWGQNGPYQISLTESNGICSDESTLFVVNNNCSISVAAVSADGNAFCPGTIAAIQAVTGATGITYQWYLNGSILNGETNADLQIETGGNYQVMITQGSCTAISQTLAITELPAVIIPDLELSQSNPGCSGGSAIISAVGGSFNSYQWSTGATSPSIEVTISGDYTVELSDNNGCVATAGPVSVNFALQDVVPICLVTVDPTTGSNLLVWEPVTSEVTSTYVIYKETNVADVYAAIGTVDYGSDGMFEDVNSNSAVQASRYKLALIDTCDIESSLSDLHKTIHLTSNLGVGNTVNLIWSHYEGFAFGSYNIYRGTASDNMTLIATIASNLNSYTDLLPLTNGYYMIEVEGVSCDPSRTLQTSTSNIINYQVEGIDEIENSSLKVYPNPAYDRVTLQCDATLIGNTYVIFDVTGREIIQGKVVGITTDIAIEQLSRGEYILKIGNDRVKIAKL